MTRPWRTVVAATERTQETASTGGFSLTRNEVQHLFATIAITRSKTLRID